MSWKSSLKSINLDAGNFHKLWFSIDESLVFVENICKSSAFSQINQKREALAVETVVEVIVVVVPLLKQNLGGVTCLPALPVQPPVSTTIWPQISVWRMSYLARSNQVIHQVRSI